MFFITQFVSDIDRLSLGGSLVSEEGLQYLKKLKKVKYLDLGGVPLNDNNLDCILHLTDVEYLYLKHTEVSSKGISRILQAFPHLETLIADIEPAESNMVETWQAQYPQCELCIS